jgi:phasin family protein
MASNGKRSAAMARNGKRSAHGTAEAAPLSATLTPEALLTRYNANCVVALDILHVTLDAASRLQRLQLERGEQALSLTEKAMRALSAGDLGDAFTVQAGLTQDALNQSVAYWERIVALSTGARRELSDLLDRQCRMNGIPSPLLFATPLPPT